MDFHTFQVNLGLAWLWIIVGFVSGFVLGSYFHREEWLGGYTSFKRRLYRLAHISFFGMAIVNLAFYFSVQQLTSNLLLSVASWGFVVGGISMPACCFAMAHNPRLRSIFLIPVISLILAGSITFAEVTGL